MTFVDPQRFHPLFEESWQHRGRLLAVVMTPGI